ncbi:flagellar biosynthesis repressor FlbT [Candidatus Liberibacter sp.]|uniref:flagellar biosynthesis repressor FlbT n=1 Tax=Candidatus Liberibacter sp. TaxID=34022 RepID=UPI0015F5E383|nr:flagellar biosynthesis repressor FlbT [Candidatus Liberibacter sp.]MBA5723545.1 flagellar biosynthesis repressor FlbT [Candidatus Liberibacter sp.]
MSGSPLRISLKSGERVFLNGADVRVDRKVILEFLNDITFILEQHILKKEEATTPLRQLYFIIQMIFMIPTRKSSLISLFQKHMSAILGLYHNESMILELKNVESLITSGRFFDALKVIRGLYPIESHEPQKSEIFASDFIYIYQEIESWKSIQK